MTAQLKTAADCTPGPWRRGPIHKDGSFAIHATKASVVHCKPFSSSAAVAAANGDMMAGAPELAEELTAFVEWAEEHRRQAKAAGERPAIDAHRVARARAALKKVGR